MGGYIDWMRPFHSQEWSISNFSCILTRNITSHSIKNLGFHHLLRWKMIILPILTTSLIPFSLKGWENVNFWTWEWRANPHHQFFQRKYSRVAFLSKCLVETRSHALEYFHIQKVECMVTSNSVKNARVQSQIYTNTHEHRFLSMETPIQTLNPRYFSFSKTPKGFRAKTPSPQSVITRPTYNSSCSVSPPSAPLTVKPLTPKSDQY